eukprot:6462146-Amphidinium_carterae.2
MPGKETLQAFKDCRKAGRNEFVTAIHAYKSRCAGYGRGYIRPAFDWVRYRMVLELQSRVDVGTKSLWLFAAETRQCHDTMLSKL